MIQTLPLLLLAVLVMFPHISETIYTPSLPHIAHSLQTSDQMVEFTLSIYFLGFALGVLSWGILADKIGRRPAMLAGIIVYLIGCIGCFFSQTIEALLFWRFIQAFGASTGSVVTQTMIRDCYTGKKRGQIFSVLGFALALAPALGPIIGGYVDQTIGWKGNFSVLIGFSFLLFIYTFFFLKETQVSKQIFKFKEVYKQLFTDVKVLNYAFLVGAANGIVFSFYAEAPFVFIDLMHYTPLQYGFCGLIICAANLSAASLSYYLNHYYSTESIIKNSCLLIVMGSLGLSFIFASQVYLQETGMINFALIAASLILIFLGINLMTPNCLSQALTAYQANIGTAGALFGLSYYLLVALFTCLMSIFHNETLLAMPLYFLGLSVCMLIVFYLSTKSVYSEEKQNIILALNVE